MIYKHYDSDQALVAGVQKVGLRLTVFDLQSKYAVDMASGGLKPIKGIIVSVSLVRDASDPKL